MYNELGSQRNYPRGSISSERALYSSEDQVRVVQVPRSIVKTKTEPKTSKEFTLLPKQYTISPLVSLHNPFQSLPLYKKKYHTPRASCKMKNTFSLTKSASPIKRSEKIISQNDAFSFGNNNKKVSTGVSTEKDNEQIINNTNFSIDMQKRNKMTREQYYEEDEKEALNEKRKRDTDEVKAENDINSSKKENKNNTKNEINKSSEIKNEEEIELEEGLKDGSKNNSHEEEEISKKDTGKFKHSSQKESEKEEKLNPILSRDFTSFKKEDDYDEQFEGFQTFKKENEDVEGLQSGFITFKKSDSAKNINDEDTKKNEKSIKEKSKIIQKEITDSIDSPLKNRKDDVSETISEMNVDFIQYNKDDHSISTERREVFIPREGTKKILDKKEDESEFSKNQSDLSKEISKKDTFNPEELLPNPKKNEEKDFISDHQQTEEISTAKQGNKGEDGFYPAPFGIVQEKKISLRKGARGSGEINEEDLKFLKNQKPDEEMNGHKKNGSFNPNDQTNTIITKIISKDTTEKGDFIINRSNVRSKTGNIPSPKGIKYAIIKMEKSPKEKDKSSSSRELPKPENESDSQKKDYSELYKEKRISFKKKSTDNNETGDFQKNPKLTEKLSFGEENPEKDSINVSLKEEDTGPEKNNKLITLGDSPSAYMNQEVSQHEEGNFAPDSLENTSSKKGEEQQKPSLTHFETSKYTTAQNIPHHFVSSKSKTSAEEEPKYSKSQNINFQTDPFSYRNYSSPKDFNFESRKAKYSQKPLSHLSEELDVFNFKRDSENKNDKKKFRNSNTNYLDTRDSYKDLIKKFQTQESKYINTSYLDTKPSIKKGDEYLNTFSTVTYDDFPYKVTNSRLNTDSYQNTHFNHNLEFPIRKYNQNIQGMRTEENEFSYKNRLTKDNLDFQRCVCGCKYDCKCGCGRKKPKKNLYMNISIQDSNSLSSSNALSSSKADYEKTSAYFKDWMNNFKKKRYIPQPSSKKETNYCITTPSFKENLSRYPYSFRDINIDVDGTKPYDAFSLNSPHEYSYHFTEEPLYEFPSKKLEIKNDNHFSRNKNNISNMDSKESLASFEKPKLNNESKASYINRDNIHGVIYQPLKDKYLGNNIYTSPADKYYNTNNKNHIFTYQINSEGILERKNPKFERLTNTDKFPFEHSNIYQSLQNKKSEFKRTKINDPCDTEILKNNEYNKNKNTINKIKAAPNRMKRNIASVNKSYSSLKKESKKTDLSKKPHNCEKIFCSRCKKEIPKEEYGKLFYKLDEYKKKRIKEEK